MAKLLMISGDRSLAEGKHGAFFNTLEEFHKHWERIDIITPKSSQFPTGRPAGDFKLFGNVFVYPSPAPVFFQPWFIAKKGRELHGRFKFDLVTVHEYAPFYNGLGARLLFNKIKIPYVLEIHHVPGFPRAASLKEKIYCFLTRKLLKTDAKKAAAVRIVNKRQMGEFMSKTGIGAAKLIYIPSMYIDLDIFKPQNSAKEYDLIFVGRLARNKGLDLFLGAVRELDRRALIVGDGPLAREAGLKIKNQKLNIKIHGWAKDSQEISDLMNKSKVLIMSSLNEGGPRVVLEAMACGLPVVATPVGIAPDIIGEFGAGMVADWSASDIAANAARILSDSAEYKKMSEAAVRAAAQFEKAAAVKNYADKLKAVLNQTRQ